ncbi:MAG: DnaJ domain-containing protein [Oscillospiraceae bacterium]|nr:DnaJ domain-containing protein [Oscillospiraceae bacterium]
MTDPYKILEISPNATDEEVKEAYRKMAKKYHPDNYAGSPLADLANEKMKEVNEAYDQIISQRKQAKNGGQSGNAGGYSAYGYGTGYTGSSSSSNSSFTDVRNLINNNRIADAEQILNGVPQDQRNAEWYFLKGTVLYKRGWMDEAYQHFSAAVQMDPNNMEYRMAFNQVSNQRNGAYGGYNPGMQQNRSGCGACDVCSSLMCADCCCECFGGDLIRCC